MVLLQDEGLFFFSFYHCGLEIKNPFILEVGFPHGDLFLCIRIGLHVLE